MIYTKISLSDLGHKPIARKKAFDESWKTSEYDVLSALNASPVAFALFSNANSNLRIIEKERKREGEVVGGLWSPRSSTVFHNRRFLRINNQNYKFYETILNLRRKKILLRSQFYFKNEDSSETGLQILQKYKILNEAIVQSSGKSKKRRSGEISLKMLLEDCIDKKSFDHSSQAIRIEKNLLREQERYGRVDVDELMDVYFTRIQPGYWAACFGVRDSRLRVVPYSLKEGQFLKELTFWIDLVFDSKWRLVEFGEHLLVVCHSEVKRLDFSIEETEKATENDDKNDLFDIPYLPDDSNIRLPDF